MNEERATHIWSGRRYHERDPDRKYTKLDLVLSYIASQPDGALTLSPNYGRWKARADEQMADLPSRPPGAPGAGASLVRKA